MKRIVIVGGGTAGWMAAAYLRRVTGREITLIESADVPTIGVGESTIPAMIEFVRRLGIDEDLFMRRCHATYKLGIEFVDWVEPRHVYWHPFGLCGGNIDGIDLFHFWLQSRAAGQETSAYSSFSLQALLAQHRRAHRLPGDEAVVANYAFQLDAAALADLLKEHAVHWGVQHVIDSVVGVDRDDQGLITYLRTRSGRSQPGDFFIDCTGFRSLLIEQTLGAAWVDWSHLLLCDAAWVLRQPADPEMPPYTRVTGASAGWIWRIPLNCRVGTGYVYSSSHLGRENAAAELLSHAAPGADAQDLRSLKMRVGRRDEFWKSNCLAIGLAGGFIEPLESTAIFLIQRALEEFVECFPAVPCPPSLVQQYNRRLAEAFDETRDFVLLHYLLSRRDDTAFWRDCRSVPLPPSIEERLALYDESAMVVEHPRNPVFRDTNFYYIYAGADRLPERPSGRTAFSDFSSVTRLMQRIKEGNQRICQRLPLHADLIQWLHQSR